MKIKYVQGDMFTHVFPEGQPKIFVHGCNAQGVIGAGVAAQIKKRYPSAYDTYRYKYDTEGLVLGEIISTWENDPDTTIIHAITQQYYGRDKNVVYVDYEAVEKCFAEIDKGCQAIQWLYDEKIEVAMPKIGCGLANGDWNIISSIIERNSNNFIPVVYEQ